MATSRVGSTTTHHGWSVARGSDCAVDLSHVAHIGEYNWFHFMQRFWRYQCSGLYKCSLRTRSGEGGEYYDYVDYVAAGLDKCKVGEFICSCD